MLFERLHIVTQAAEQEAFVVLKAREALEVMGAVLLESIRVGAGLFVFSFEQLKEYFYPTPALSAEAKDQVLQEAANFVHAKHRVGEDDYFHEYLWVANERLSIKWEEMYGGN